MARQPARRIDSIRIGDTRILTPGRRLARPRDLYHLALTLTWPRFFAALVFLFTLVNLVFGFLYWLSPGSVSNARGDSFLDHFFFSVETLATVGYGVMSPGSLYGHLVATSEILSGLVGIALITGLVFARFSKPTARILFSDRAVIRDFNGERVLMLRIANQRHSHRIVEATASMSLVRSEVSSDGEDFVAIHDLHLLRDRNPVFALTWTLVHAIDERSPLHGLESAQLAASQSRLVVSIGGRDETVAASVYAVGNYRAEDVVFEARFVDILAVTPTGERVVDMTRFHDIERALTRSGQ